MSDTGVILESTEGIGDGPPICQSPIMPYKSRHTVTDTADPRFCARPPAQTRHLNSPLVLAAGRSRSALISFFSSGTALQFWGRLQPNRRRLEANRRQL